VLSGVAAKTTERCPPAATVQYPDAGVAAVAGLRGVKKLRKRTGIPANKTRGRLKLALCWRLSSAASFGRGDVRNEEIIGT
jgi:hypothetical protein